MLSREVFFFFLNTGDVIFFHCPRLSDVIASAWDNPVQRIPGEDSTGHPGQWGCLIEAVSCRSEAATRRWETALSGTAWKGRTHSK